MSSMESWKLKLKKTDLTLSQAVKAVVEKTGLSGHYDLSDEEDMYDYILNEGEDFYIYVDGVIWEVVNKHCFDYSDFTNVVNNDDGSLDIIAVFYNGGTDLSEVIGKCLDGMDV